MVAAGMGTMSSEPDFAPLRDRLVALRRRTLVALAEQPEDGSLDAGLLAIVANVQTALVARQVIECCRVRWQMFSMLNN